MNAGSHALFRDGRRGRKSCNSKGDGGWETKTALDWADPRRAERLLQTRACSRAEEKKAQEIIGELKRGGGNLVSPSRP